MTIEERIAEKFKTLLAEGKALLHQSGWDGRIYQGNVDDVDYVRFRTEALNLIKRACGQDSDHYKNLKRLAEDQNTALNSHYFKDCYGVLDAASRDYEGGMLFEVRSMVTAEVLDDFLEQAEHLSSKDSMYRQHLLPVPCLKMRFASSRKQKAFSCPIRPRLTNSILN